MAKYQLVEVLRIEILERDNHTCQYCGTQETKCDVDHILPRSEGGIDEPYNLIAACRLCNFAKYDDVLLFSHKTRRFEVKRRYSNSIGQLPCFMSITPKKQILFPNSLNPLLRDMVKSKEEKAYAATEE